MKRNIKISLFLFLVLYPFNCRAQVNGMKGKTDNWWNKKIVLDKIKLPEDRYCAGHYIISSLQNSGIPTCAEYYPIVKGRDVKLEIKSEISAKDKIWITIPRKSPWNLLATADNIASTTTVLDYYAHQAGNYKLRFINNVPVIIPDKGEVLTEKIKIQKFMLKDACIREVYENLSNDLIGNNISWIIPIIGFRSMDAPEPKNINDIIDNFNTNVKFDLNFSGGTLAEVLCEMTRLLGESDTEHLFFWTLGGLSDQRCLGFGCVEKARYNNLVSEQGDDAGHNKSNSGEIIKIKQY